MFFSGVPPLPPGSMEYQGLWQAQVIKLYLGILDNGSNPVTVEAAAGAIQNLTACFWTVSTEYLLYCLGFRYGYMFTIFALD